MTSPPLDRILRVLWFETDIPLRLAGLATFHKRLSALLLIH